ncbi:MAG: trehalose-phosphatase [Dehalococcoidia bacterium]|jgi:alpha,alpha-trehalase
MSRSRKITVDFEGIDAVIFDMDGVVTDTAGTHAGAWKRMFDDYLKKHAASSGTRFRAFDIHTDYNRYVDGKPRQDGVMSFLESRGISLPYGKPGDRAGRETVCGLGNLKNRYFLEMIKSRGVDVYSSTVDLVHELREHGLGTAVITSSLNYDEIMGAAGMGDLFSIKVDGAYASRLGLKGKPDPAFFLEAARLLGVEPGNVAIVEDAQSGVEAGRLGGFRLVIGVDRVGQAEELKVMGANVVVSDLSELKIRWPEKPGTRKAAAKNLCNLPSALENRAEIFEFLHRGTPAVFLDYDGTLTPIVSRPEDAVLKEDTRRVVKRLAEQWTVAILSGRDLPDVQKMVKVDDIVYAGSHGFDIVGPSIVKQENDIGQRFLPHLDRVEAELHEVLADIPGARVERKRFAIAVHYRQVDDSLLGKLEEKVDRIFAREPELRKSTGKKIFEFVPNIKWNKGEALLSLLDTLFVDSSKVVPLFIGDDTTDEDAFRAIEDRGVSIIVGCEDRPTAAQYVLRDPEEVREFLEFLVEKGLMTASWTLVYTGFDPEQEQLREALCTLGNGCFATRGAAPESGADGVHYPGTYVAGCYNRLKTEIAGRVVENECMVNMPNWLPLSFRAEGGRWFNLGEAELLSYRQELDLRRGLLRRYIHFSDENGRKTKVFERRFVNMADPGLAALETTIIPKNWSGQLDVRSALDGGVANSGVKRYRELNNKHLLPIKSLQVNANTIFLQMETSQSRIHVAEAARTVIIRNGEEIKSKRKLTRTREYIAQELSVPVNAGEAITVEKVVSITTSRDRAISESGLEAIKKIERAPGFNQLQESHALRWSHLWRRCGIEMEDAPRTSLILNLHVFHLLQTLSLNTIDHDAGVPARGLHGEAYRGHIFWDEIFVFPSLNLRIPDISRALQLYRYRRLPEARWAAKQAGYAGAMYPWQSGSDGREETQQLHLNPKSGRWLPDNSHLQRHINIAIAYNIWLYYQATADINFLSYYGAEMIIEIARFWASITSYNQSTNRYEILKVMGPDEYHDSYPDADEPGLNNNAYTNVMAAWIFCRALDVIDILPDDRRKALREKLGVSKEEMERWDDISRKMCIFFHDDNIISQFEGYDTLDEFDWNGYREKYGDIHRLDRILEAEGDTPNRYKVSKQADVLMLFYLLSDDELCELFCRLGYTFDYDAIRRNTEYYLARTSHGSTLSRVVHAWVLARSLREESWRFFQEALESDISDVQGGTTSEGIHLGAMAGTVDIIQRCYTGIETRGNRLIINPCLPENLKKMRFNIVYRRHWLDFEITGEHLRINTRRRNTAPIEFTFRDTNYTLKPGESIELKL